MHHPADKGTKSHRPLLWAATLVVGGTALATCAPASATETAQRPSAFLQCAACHATVAGKNGVGPSLHGVVGRKAGTADGYSYSRALAASSITWDEKSLDQWISGPSKMLPGNKMPFMGLSDPAKRGAVITYLKTLK